MESKDRSQTDVIVVARARFFAGSLSTRRVLVEPDGSVLPWTRWRATTRGVMD